MTSGERFAMLSPVSSAQCLRGTARPRYYPGANTRLFSTRCPILRLLFLSTGARRSFDPAVKRIQTPVSRVEKSKFITDIDNIISTIFYLSRRNLKFPAIHKFLPCFSYQQARVYDRSNLRLNATRIEVVSRLWKNGNLLQCTSVDIDNVVPGRFFNLRKLDVSSTIPRANIRNIRVYFSLSADRSSISRLNVHSRSYRV